MTAFSGLCGNEKTKERLLRTLNSGTLPHAFIIKGPKGCGKHTLTDEIAAAIHCENREDGSNLPCHACRSCRRIFAHQFTDMKFLSKAGDKASIGVKEVRDFREDMFLSPSESDCKIYVFENAEFMTTQAQNALLKVLEEPPGRMYVFLLTESEDKILTTVKSRAQRISMELFDTETLCRFMLQKSEAARSLKTRSQEDFSAMIMRAGGRIGAALSLFDSSSVFEENALRETVGTILSASLPGCSYEKLHHAIHLLPPRRNEFAEAVDRLLLAIRDLIAVKNGMDSGSLLYFLNMDEAQATAEKFKLPRLFQLFEIYRTAQDQNAKNGNLTLITVAITTATSKL